MDAKRELTNPKALLVISLLSLVHQTSTKQCDSGNKLTLPPSDCCPTKYLAFCCPHLSKPCNKTAAEITRGPSNSPPGIISNVENTTGGGFTKPFCIHPWNSSACQDGFFYDSFARKTKPCPAGFYCPNDELCIVPCPKGAFCGSNRLVSARRNSNSMCQKARQCCDPANIPPVFEPTENRYICPGPKSPDPCPEGSYCPTVTTRKPCPEDYFCRVGTVDPDPCPIMTVCNRRTTAPIGSYGAPLLLLFLVALFIVVVIAFNRRKLIVFYSSLYYDRYVSKRERTDTQAFSLERGLKAAVDRYGDLQRCRSNIVPKQFTVDIKFENLSLTLKSVSKKKVLAGVTGTIKSGEVTAVMGPSGAGKTTFLNTLSGKAYYGIRYGKILINGIETENLDVYRTITGFVPQEDIMHRNLTVTEVLTYQAELRLPASVSEDKKREKVKQVIEILDLEGVKESQIGDEETRGISGGQRKRVNIGMELVADPTLLFLDEPTSGLDSTSSLSVMDALKAVAEKGRLTVMCVIHQPRYEIFRMFHNLLFLGPGGKTVFQGGVEEAARYFSNLGIVKPENVNPADFYMDVIGGQYTEEDGSKVELFRRYESYRDDRDGSDTNSNQLANKEVGMSNQGLDEESILVDVQKPGRSPTEGFVKRKMPGVFRQFFTFLYREIILQFRIIKSLVIDQALVLLAGGILGGLHNETPLEEFFMMQTLSSLAIGLTAMLSSLRCFGQHRTTFWRESASGVNRFSYFMAVNVAQLPIIIITPLVYQSLLYTLTSPRGLFKFHYLATLGAQFACTGTGYFFSTIFNPKNSQMASVVFVLINGLLSGSSPSLCTLDNTKIGPIFYNLSFARWFMEALFEKEAVRYPEVMSPLVNSIANKNNYSLDNYSLCIVLLFVLGIMYRIFAFLSLVFTNRGKQK